MNSKGKHGIVFGDFELDADEFAPRNVKVRITTMIDEDALQALKSLAKARGLKYQTLLNQLIRAFVDGPRSKKKAAPTLTEAKIRRIVREEIKRSA